MKVTEPSSLKTTESPVFEERVEKVNDVPVNEEEGAEKTNDDVEKVSKHTGEMSEVVERVAEDGEGGHDVESAR